MAFNIRKVEITPFEMALVKAYNATRTGLCSTTLFHADETCYDATGSGLDPTASAMLVAGTAVDQPSLIALTNELQNKMNIHMADTLAHAAADSSNGPLTTAVATDRTSTNTSLNAFKAAYNLHLAQANVHYNNDGNANATAAADTAMTAVTHSAGTGGTVSISGTPVATLASLEIDVYDVTTGGSTDTTALFAVKVNGVAFLTGLTASTTGTAMTGTGLTATFGAGTYVTTDVYKATSTSVAMAAALKAAYNIHIASAPAGSSIRLLGA
jgi:hypothetical protein